VPPTRPGRCSPLGSLPRTVARCSGAVRRGPRSPLRDAGGRTGLVRSRGVRRRTGRASGRTLKKSLNRPRRRPLPRVALPPISRSSLSWSSHPQNHRIPGAQSPHRSPAAGRDRRSVRAHRHVPPAQTLQKQGVSTSKTTVAGELGRRGRPAHDSVRSLWASSWPIVTRRMDSARPVSGSTSTRAPFRRGSPVATS
jgi:hypothetical protein